jgi:CHASE3 domain sensor protein
VRQSQGFDAAREAIAHGDGGKAMNDIRTLVELLGDNERNLLMRRQAVGRQHERDTLLVGIFIAALSVTTRILIAFGLKWYHRKKRSENQEAAAA